MDNLIYQVKESRSAQIKLVLICLLLMLWYFIQAPILSFFICQSFSLSGCTQEQLYTIINLQVLGDIPLCSILIYFIYYGYKIIIQQHIPPAGNCFPASIHNATKKDTNLIGTFIMLFSALFLFTYINKNYNLLSLTHI